MKKTKSTTAVSYGDIFAKFIFGALLLATAYIIVSYVVVQINPNLSVGNDGYRVFAQSGDVGGDASAGNVGGDAGTGDVGGDASAGNVGGDAGTGDVGGDASAGNVGGDAGTGDVGGDASAGNVGGDAGTGDVGGDASAGNVGGDAGTGDVGGDIGTGVTPNGPSSPDAPNGPSEPNNPSGTLPNCDSFTATPSTLASAGQVTLTWNTTNATAVTINGDPVAVDGVIIVTVAADTAFTLIASDGTNTDNCQAAVDLTTTATNLPVCVSFTAAPATLPVGGGNVTLTWDTTNTTGVSISPTIGTVTEDGTVSTSVTGNTTFTLTAQNANGSVNCTASVTVGTNPTTPTGGGGGGSSAPRCELTASDTRITLGERVVLTWNSTRASNLTLENTTSDEVLVTTENLSSSEKARLFRGTITVEPKEDTTYLLTVRRGSSTRTCEVAIVMDVTVTETRDLVSSIELTEVPYTGFEAGPIMTTMFYALLVLWALFIAYVTVIRRDTIGGVALAHTPHIVSDSLRSSVFVAEVKAPEMPVSSLFPDDLPTGAPVVGYASLSDVAVSSNTHSIDDEEMTYIENYAHSKRVLLSSDAIRHFIATTAKDERTFALDKALQTAKAKYPAEDGWIVINEKRMQEVCAVCQANKVRSSEVPYVPAVIPEGAGSLAEAIVIGNVVAAYEMIGNRPMFALADAAADFDAVYRLRKGEETVASELLKEHTTDLTDEQILEIIKALTSALDGTYTDEPSAVKMSIMKAIKVVAK
jgi:hypothetical protein